MTENTRVLVVDDEKKICEDLKAYLTYHGHEVEIALGGEEGLEKLKSFRPHVVLLDVRMPGISGLEALARMREFDPSVRITMVTAVHEESVAKMAVQEGADNYITKPIDLEYLNTCIMLQYIDSVG